MTVSTELSHEEYTGNGVTTDFDFRFRIFEAKHLVVSVADQDGTERILTNGTDYTLRGVGSYRGGKVILKMPLATGWKIGIARDLPAVQETDLRNQGKFFAEVHEDAFDYLTMLIQKSLGYLSLCLRKPSFISDHYDAKGNKISNLGKPVKDDDAVDLGTMKEHISEKDKRSLRVADKDIPALPNSANRANKMLAFDNDGNPKVVLPESGSAADVLLELAKPTGAGLVGTESGKTVQSEISKLINMSDKLRSSKYSMHGAGKSLGTENTIISCSLLKNYFDIIDVDLSTTSDGVAILMHDTNSTPLDGVTGSVSEYNYSQIKDRRNLLFDNTPFEGTTVTAWDEFMLFCASRGKYVTAELKNTQGTESSMLGIYRPIVNNNMLGRVNLQCLNVSRLKDYRTITNDKITQLLTLVYDGMPNEDLDYVISETILLGNSGINVDINYSKLPELIDKAKEKRILVNFWTAKQYTDEISVLSKFPGHQISTDYMVI